MCGQDDHAATNVNLATATTTTEAADHKGTGIDPHALCASAILEAHVAAKNFWPQIDGGRFRYLN